MSHLLQRILLLCIFLGASTISVGAQTYERLYGWCEQGNQVVTTDGRQSVTKVQRSYPSCTITVYDQGTTDLADISSDYSGTPKSNPFTADTNGYWSFFGLQGRYDVRLSGSGITSPFTLPGLWVRTGGSGGGGDTNSCDAQIVGRLTKFTATDTICNSNFAESGTTDTLTGQLVINQSSTGTAALSVTAVAASLFDLADFKDSSGATKFGIRTTGVPLFKSYSSAPAVSLASEATIYYDITGGSLNGTLALSRNTGGYQFIISAATDGISGDCLKTNGSKTFTFGNCDAALAIPDTQIVWGTGTSVSSANTFTYEDSTGELRVRNLVPTTIFDFLPVSGYLAISPFGSSAGNTTEIRQLELLANGTNYFAVKAADNIATTRTMLWPNDDPAASEVLTVTSYSSNLITTEWAPAANACGTNSDNKEVIYDNAGVCTGANGFEYQAAASPHVLIQAQGDGFVPLNIVTFDTTPTTDLFSITTTIVGGNKVFAVSSAGAPYTPQTLTGGSGERFGFGSTAVDPSIAFGNGATAGQDAAALGYQTTAVATSVAIGRTASTTAANQLVIGSGLVPLYEVRFGSGSSEVVGVNQAIKLYGTSTNSANAGGGDMVLVGGRPRGTGASTGDGAHGSVRFETYTLPGTSGISQGNRADRFTVDGQKFLVGTNNTAQSLFEIALPTLTGTTGKLFYEVYVSDNTDVQEVYGEASFAAVNKAAAYTTAVADDHQQSALSAGTLTVATSLVSGSDKITVKITPNSSLTAATGKYWIHWTLVVNHEQRITILP